MRRLLFISFYFLIPGLSAQDTLSITINDIVLPQFSPTPLDSAFTNFYIENEKDTVYFNTRLFVISPQLTNPTTIIYSTKNGLAMGHLEYFLTNEDGATSYKGEFSDGYFIAGIATHYSKNGTVLKFGKMVNHQAVGWWEFYTTTGELACRRYFIDGVCELE